MCIAHPRQPLQQDAVPLSYHDASEAGRTLVFAGASQELRGIASLSCMIMRAFRAVQVETQSVHGYSLLFRVGELWPLLQRRQAFHNWYTKLSPGCMT